MGGGKRLQALAELLEEIIGRTAMLRGLPRHGLDHRQQILRAMRQFAQQQPQMRFALLARGDVDRSAGQSHDGARLLTQRLDMQVVPTQVGSVGEREFAALGLPARQRRALERDDGGRIIGRQDFFVGTAEHVLDRTAKQGIADRGVAQS